MGVDRLPSGSYRARLMIDGKTYTATFPTKGEVDEWLVVMRGRAIEARRASRLTVEQYADQWLGSFIDDAVGIEGSRHDVEQYIVPVLGPRLLAEVPAAEVTALLEHVQETVSPAAATQLRSTLQDLSADAVADGLFLEIRSSLTESDGRSEPSGAQSP